MKDTFKGYCFDKNGFHTPAVILNDVPAVISYCKSHGDLQYEVRITDYMGNSIVMQVIEGVVVWPNELKGRSVKDLP